ncbi:MAG: hypothetical protein J6P73_07745 [Bacteroidales bacterium]|nr:hypothetical protein [Bacteroidales bacterium]
MKKVIYSLVIVLALGLMGCDHETKTAKSLNNSDFVIVDHGKMSFYDAETQKLTPYETETDSVINLLFTDYDHLYYTVSKDQNLSLKMLDLSQAAAEPTLCADWNVKLNDVIDFMFGKVSNIYLDIEGGNIIIYSIDPEDVMMWPLAYNLESGKVRRLNDDESFSLSIFEHNFDDSHFYTEYRHFYYVSPEGKACLNDKLNLKAYFTDVDELDEVEFTPIAMSPDGKRVVYSAAVYWGEGWGCYCVADVDGKSQLLMSDTDIWQGRPEWIANGSLVYVGKAQLPESDPEYDADYNTTTPCIHLLDAQNNIVAVGLGEIFATRPLETRLKDKEEQVGFEGCDVATLDNGKLIFYNSTAGTFVPDVLEKDSVINGVFVEDVFYYTVAIGNHLYLKEQEMTDYEPTPRMVTDWDLQLDDCVSQTYGKASGLYWMPKFQCIRINHTFSWDAYDFYDANFYFIEKGVKQKGYGKAVKRDDCYYNDPQRESDWEKFVEENSNYYYTVGGRVCVSDKIDFKSYVSDPEYYSEPEFVFYSIDPTRQFVAYAALIEWGDLGHGPLCMASLDGKMQVAFDGTDASDLSWGWMSDGSLLYVGVEPRPADDPEYDPEWNTTKPCVIIVYPDGTSEVFSHSTDFIVKGN